MASFNDFISRAISDTVNLGDTLLTAEEERLEEARRRVEVELKLDRDGRFIGDENPYVEED